MYPILKKRYLNEAKTTIEMVVEAPLVAKKCLAGQFIIFRIDEFGERIPLTIADYDRKKGTVTVMFQPAAPPQRSLPRFPRAIRFSILQVLLASRPRSKDFPASP